MIRTGLLRDTRHGKVGGSHGPLSLVPMIDILTIIVVYLLVHAADAELLSNPRNVSMPMSVSELKPREATVITVARDMLYVNGEEVVSVAEVAASTEPVVERLRVKLRKQAKSLLGSSAEEREITVIADKSLMYPVLRRIVASCSAAEYTKVSLAVVEREQALASLPGA
ncbi:MAG TPA: biopolymer transporter ExbD [Steroidobacteraceae bacterium]|jgi:biopolymer transport protein TolR|nr:biopolymer transporter ExbD [Steroidobacteraceae bacterium]